MKKRRFSLFGAIGALVGLASALALAAAFYGVMAYQLAGGKEEGQQPAAVRETRVSEGALLALEGAQLVSQETLPAQYGGGTCTAVMRTYRHGGMEATLVTAQPAAYIERLSAEGYVPQLITGYTLAGMEAVYSVRGEEAVLSARDNDKVFLLFAPAGEQEIYALGLAAYLE